MSDDTGESLAQISCLAIVAAGVSCLLVTAWMWTAKFSWSSDTWLLCIPALIVFTGIVSLIGLIAIYHVRRKKNSVQPGKKTENPISKP